MIKKCINCKYFLNCKNAKEEIINCDIYKEKNIREEIKNIKGR